MTTRTVEQVDKEQAELRLLRAEKSFIHFLDYVYIMEPPQAFAETNAAGGRTKLELWPHISEMAEAFQGHSHVVIGKERQIGFSWLVAAYALWTVLFKEGAVVLMLSRGETEAQVLLQKSKTIYVFLPKRWQKQRKRDKDSGSEFAIGSMSSKITALASTRDAGRSETASIVIQDEADFHEYAAENFAAIGPTIDAGGQIIVGSTGNKRKARSTFKGFIRNAPQNAWHPLFYGRYTRPGRDDAWYEYTKAHIPDEALEEMSPDLYMEQEYPRCLAPETLVSTTNEGIVRISDSKLGFQSGMDSRWELRTTAGRRLLVTKEHRIKTPNCYVPVQDLHVGDEISLMQPEFVADSYAQVSMPSRFHLESRSITIDETWGRFLGFFVGDGSISGTLDSTRLISQTVSIVCDGRDHDVVDLVVKDFSKLLGIPATRSVGSKKGGTEVRKTSKDYLELFKALGVVKPSGVARQALRKVCVPPVIFQSPRSVVKEFLRGLWEADGFVQDGKPRMVLYSKYEKFLQDVQFLMMGFGIASRIRTAEKRGVTNGKPYSFIGYELVLRKPEVLEFGKQIEFISERKRRRFSSFSQRDIGNGWSAPMRWVDEVASITPDYDYGDVWDATVSETHCFSAAGIWVHNSLEEMLAPARASAWFDQEMLRIMETNVQNPIMTLVEDDYRGKLCFYIRRTPRGRYSSGTDLGHGVGADYSATVILDLHAGRIVADIMDNTTKPDEFIEESIKLLKVYKRPIWGIERNDLGQEANDLAVLLNYPRLFHRETSRTRGAERHQKAEPGWQTTPSNRTFLFGELARVVDSGEFIIPNREGLAQFWNVIRTGESGRPDHLVGTNDDYVVACGIAWQMRHHAFTSMGATRFGEERVRSLPSSW